MTGELSFGDYLKKTGEVGYVSQVQHWVVQVEGLPGAGLGEMVVFEQGQPGQVTALSASAVEVVVLSRESVVVGKRVARTGQMLKIPVGDTVLGKTVDAMGRGMAGGQPKPGEGMPAGDMWRKKK